MTTYDEGFDAKGKFSEVMLSSWRLFPRTLDLQARGIVNWWCASVGTVLHTYANRYQSTQHEKAELLNPCHPGLSHSFVCVCVCVCVCRVMCQPM